MWTIVALGAGLAIGFVVGLLVGRRNPKIADAAAVGANEAKTIAGKAVNAVKK